jgi:hypothetical protein
MEEITLEKRQEDNFPYNSPLEAGVRSVVILDEAYPRFYDLSQLTWMDHIVVHSADLDGPPSIHLDLPQRTGEILVRRKLVESGLNLMRRLHMLEISAQEQGIYYRATEEAKPFVSLMNTKYSVLLKERAKWLAEDIGRLGYDDMKQLVVKRLGRWSVEFNGATNERG